MSLELRRGTAADRKRVFEISAQIWEGDDYVPQVFDRWIDDPETEFVVAELDGVVVAFARRGWLFPGYAWLQGIRTDPAYRGRGGAKAITDHFIEAAKREKAETIGLLTYIHNEASIHIIEQRGFEQVASYVFVEGELRPGEAGADLQPVEVPETEALQFIANSAWHRIARGYFPSGWTIHPFDRASDAALAFASRRLGVRDGDGLRSLLCLAPSSTAEGSHFLSFLDGNREDLLPLLRHALRATATTRTEAMIPQFEGEVATALVPLLAGGLQTWNDGRADIFAYELDLVRDTRSPLS
jgi:GNAT superfamily N-acetyltransferase